MISEEDKRNFNSDKLLIKIDRQLEDYYEELIDRIMSLEERLNEIEIKLKENGM